MTPVAQDARTLQAAVSGAIRFLVDRQLNSGEFQTFVCSDPELSCDCVVESATFPTAIVLHGLYKADDKAVDQKADSQGTDPDTYPAVRRAVQFLLSELVDPGVWRYSTRLTPMQFGPDVDDTALISYVIRGFVQRFAERGLGEGIGGDIWPVLDQLAAVSRRAMLEYRDDDGRFLTWMRPKDSPHPNDVDSIVNANALLFLGEDDETEPVVTYLESVLDQDEEAVSYGYYLHPLALYYALARAAEAGCGRLGHRRPDILAKVARFRQPDGSYGNELETALALATRVALSTRFVDDSCPEDLRATVANLLASQAADGSWAQRAYYCGPAPPAKTRCWYGSPEITTALALEALVTFRERCAAQA